MANTFFAYKWFEHQGWKAFPFQENTWKAYLDGYSGLVNAPTGSGKTYSLLIPALLEYLHTPPPQPERLQLIWITPIRALAKEIKKQTVEVSPTNVDYNT